MPDPHLAGRRDRFGFTRESRSMTFDPPDLGHLMAGQVDWLPGGSRAPITNVGQNPSQIHNPGISLEEVSRLMWGQPPRLSVERSETSLFETRNRRTARRLYPPHHRLPPLPQLHQQLLHPNPPKLPRTRRQIPPRPRHQRTSPHHIPRRMMMQRHRRLNQPLQKSLLHPVRLPPHVLPNLMRVIKLPRIEMPDPNLISLPKSHPEDSTEADLPGSVYVGTGAFGRPSSAARRGETGNKGVENHLFPKFLSSPQNAPISPNPIFLIEIEIPIPFRFTPSNLIK